MPEGSAFLLAVPGSTENSNPLTENDGNLNPLARASSSHKSVRVFRQGVTKSSGAKIERFACIVSFTKCNFWSLSAVAGFSAPEAPEGSAFLLVVPRAVTGGPPLPPVLSLYLFGTKESPNGTSLAMYPSASFASQPQGYVSKGRHFLSDAPFGRFP